MRGNQSNQILFNSHRRHKMYKIGINFTPSDETSLYLNALTNAGHTVVNLDNKANPQSVDMVLLQENATDDFKDICEQILLTTRQTDSLIWILSTSFVQVNRVIYLQLGADQIINLKQEETVSFLLQLKNSVNKMKKNTSSAEFIHDPSTVTKNADALQLLPESLSVILDNQRGIQLTPLEFSTLSILKENAGELMTYKKLFQAIWKDTNADKQYRLNNLIFHLRKKIEKDTKKPELIKTIRSRGYMLVI